MKTNRDIENVKKQTGCDIDKVKQLRERTGSKYITIVECLDKSDWDVDKAFLLIRDTVMIKG